MPFPRPKKTDSEDVLYEYAVGALARRMRSVAELKRLLRPRVEADQRAFSLCEIQDGSRKHREGRKSSRFEIRRLRVGGSQGCL